MILSLKNDNSRSPFENRSIWRILGIVVFTLAVTARLLPGARTIDDAFITFRYARNILAGSGFTYNLGEYVLGTTTALYTILLSVLGSISGGVDAPFANIALGINALSDGFTCILLLYLGRRLGFSLAGLGAAAVWAIAPFSVTFAIGGLETSVYVLLLTGLAVAHVSERHILAALLAALALLTRLDALILIAPLALDRVWQIIAGIRSQQPYSPLIILFESLVFIVPISAWSLYAFATFGSPIPHSIIAKTLAYQLKPEEGLVRLLQHYGTPFMGHLTFGVPWIGIGIVLYMFLFLVGALNALRATVRIWPYVIYPWLYLFVFALANPLIFRWYLTPPLPAYMLFILIGLEKTIGELLNEGTSRMFYKHPERISPSLNLFRIIVMILIIILFPLALSLRGWETKPDHGLGRPAPRMAWYKLELLYHQAAGLLLPDLSARQNKNPTIAAGDVGILGFYTSFQILDTVGLNSRMTLDYYPLDPEIYVIHYAVSPDLILDELPDYIVILEVYGREGLLKDPRFWDEYTLREKIPTDIYGSDGMLILER